MKIIAETEKGYLLEANKYEIAHLQDARYGNVSIGQEIKVSEIYSRLKHIEQGTETINRTAQNLRALADVLETQKPVIEKICIDEKEKESEEK